MIWLGAYLLGYVLLWRRVTWYIIQDLAMGDPNPDGDCLVGGAVVGSIFTFGWERRVAEMERDLGIDLDAVARLGRR